MSEQEIMSLSYELDLLQQQPQTPDVVARLRELQRKFDLFSQPEAQS